MYSGIRIEIKREIDKEQFIWLMPIFFPT